MQKSELSKTLYMVLFSVLLVAGACSKPESGNRVDDTTDQMSAPADEPAARPTDLRALLADPSRPAEDRARDATRRPADVIEFLGIEPGMRVLDVMAAGGYYTEVLSRAVGPDGAVVAQNPDAMLQFHDGANEKAISARLAGNRLPNVTRLNSNFDAIDTDVGRFDAAITALNFHDVYNGSGQDAAVGMMRKIYSLLKPGGVFGVIDHVGVADADNESLHRAQKAQAVETAQAAGFVVEGDSNLLANPDDDHTKAVFDESIRGNTDRFLLKLRKPAD